MSHLPRIQPTASPPSQPHHAMAQAHTAKRRQLMRLLAAGAASVALPCLAQPAGAGGRTITLVVSFPAGGSLDGYARTFAAELSAAGQAVVVENIGGAAGALGAQRVLRANPDGQTVLFGSVNDLVLAPLTNRQAGYSTDSFTVLNLVNTTSPVLLAGPKWPQGDFDELVRASRAKPLGIAQGSPGVGTFQHLAAALIEQQLGIDWLHVPYRGAAPLMTDLLGGQIELAVVALPAAMAQLRANKLRSLGLLRGKRDATAPELATINETVSIKGVDIQLWAGLAVGANVPAAQVASLRALFAPLVRSQNMVAYNTKTGSETPDASFDAPRFERMVQAEVQRFKPLVARLKLDAA
jgi:tripartite-type tricarboxylate transporter receptor subunit TctC